MKTTPKTKPIDLCYRFGFVRPTYWAMRLGSFIAAGLIVLVLGWLAKSQAATLEVGDEAPDFALPDQDGATVKLSGFRGKKSVVLAFYIRAFTPG
jgi:cytochrome oxidase Cu insertion factor (SCO1/SenC/PrrC family)